MRTFNDGMGRPWSLSINTAARAKVRKDTAGIDLFAAVNGEFQEQVQDPEKLVMVLYALCEDQAVKASVTPEAFAAGMTGQALEDGYLALFGAVNDFFPPRQRDLREKALAKMMEASRMVTDRASKAMDEMTADAIVQSMLKNSATTSPASSALTPDPSPSANSPG